MLRVLRAHWPEYLIEMWALGVFMASACFVALLLQHPGSPLGALLPDAMLRRVLGGVAMGLTLIAVVYSPWGRRSGAHLNPALTLTYLRLGKVAPWDAAFYVAAQFLGGIAGVAVVAAMTGCGTLVAIWISIEAPLSGMSMNPARTLGSALPARLFVALWLYFTAPPLGMLLAGEAYRRRYGLARVFCAKLMHDRGRPCIFRCNHAALDASA